MCVYIHIHTYIYVCARLVTQSCWTLRPQDCSPAGSFENTRVGCHFLLQGNLSHSGIEPTSLRLLRWQAGSLPLAPLWKPIHICVCMYSCCSVAQSCPTFLDCLDGSTLGLPVPHHLLKFARGHCIGDAIIYTYTYVYIYIHI